MKVTLPSQYSVDEARQELGFVLKLLEENQIAAIADVELRFRAIDLDGRVTFPADEKGEHAGFRVARPEARDPGQLRTSRVSWYFPWVKGAEWPTLASE